MYRTSLSVMFKRVMMLVIVLSTKVHCSMKSSTPATSVIGEGGWHVRCQVGRPLLAIVKEDTKLDRNPAVVVLLDEVEVSPVDLE